jgi:hypothetical protein
MSERILKLLGTEVALSAATTLNNAQLVRVYNDTAGAVLVSIVDQSDSTTGTVTVKAGDTIFVRKQALETIEAAAAVKAVSVGFGD